MFHPDPSLLSEWKKCNQKISIPISRVVRLVHQKSCNSRMCPISSAQSVPAKAAQECFEINTALFDARAYVHEAKKPTSSWYGPRSGVSLLGTWAQISDVMLLGQTAVQSKPNVPSRLQRDGSNRCSLHNVAGLGNGGFNQNQCKSSKSHNTSI